MINFADDLIYESSVDELSTILERFAPEQLPLPTWIQLQIMLSNLLLKNGRQEYALRVCRRTLKRATEPADQARIYRRMGKLYEQHNQLHALGYYQQALDGLSQDDPELLDLLKDRAWLYILRHEWHQAEEDLDLALKNAASSAKEQQADIFDALATLYRHQEQFDSAIQFARKALTLREETGNLGRIASSFGNLGPTLYRHGRVFPRHFGPSRCHRDIPNPGQSKSPLPPFSSTLALPAT